MKIRKIYFENEGIKIESILHLPENETNSLIILVHGFTGSKDGPGDAFTNLAKRLASENFAVLRFNFRFTTDNWSEFHKMTMAGEVIDLKLIINEMSKKYDKIGLVGESMGGSISILSYNEKVRCLVLWYSGIFRREIPTIKKFLSNESLKELEETGFVKIKKSNGQEFKVGRGFIEENKTIDILPYAKKISSPVLLIHGDVDSVTPFSQSERLLAILKEPKKLEKIAEANHAWKNRNRTDYNLKAQEEAIELTVDWFNKWLK